MSRDATIIEAVTFRTRPAAGEAAVTAASAAADAFLRRQPGFHARTLARRSDGTYVDLVWWTDRSAAEAAVAAYLADPVSAAFGAVIEPDSIVLEHLDVVVPGP